MYLFQRWEWPKLLSGFSVNYFKNSPCVRHEVIRESGDMAPLIPNFGIRWRACD